MNAVEQIVTPPKQSRRYHPPCPICNNLSGANTLVLEPVGKLLLVYAQERDHVRYLAGCGSGLMTGALLGGAGRTGSLVGATGSSNGTTV
jgi:hypothetical protein